MRVAKDMSQLHNLPRASLLNKQKKGVLKDYSNKHRVSVAWDLNDEAKRDKIFILQVDDKVVYLDAEELTHYIRFV